MSVESNHNAGGGGYSSSNTIPARYGNNVQITTSRITTEKGETGSGQLTATRPDSSSAAKGSTSTGTRAGYQFYEKRY